MTQLENSSQLSIRRVGIAAVLAIIFSAAASAQTAATHATADNEYQTGATLWQQSSGEARALQYQAYRLARLMLDRDLQIHNRSKLKRAVVVDVDETILDNSRFQAGLIVNHSAFDSKEWVAWCNSAKASAIPGAVEFLTYAAGRWVRARTTSNPVRLLALG